MNRKSFFSFLSITVTMLVITACSNEEPAHPEEPLEAYVNAWSSQSFEEMLDQLSEESMNQISDFEWDFQERYEKVYSDLGVENMEITFESRDYTEEEIDLEELEEVDYSIFIEMETLVGKLSYETDVKMNKQVTADEEEEQEEWVINWDPSHLMMRMQEPDDQIAIEIEQPERGEIFDRNGEPLAINGEIYEGGLVPESSDDLDEAAIEFAEVLGLDEERVIEQANQFPDNPDWFAPIQNLSLTDDRIEDLLEIQGVLLNRVDGREYPYGDITGHLVGHIGAITADEIEDREGEGYNATSEIGKNGIELLLEAELRGEPGISFSVLSEEGETRDVIKTTDPNHGDDVTLTLDIDMQEKMSDVLDEDSGSGVVIDPLSGETLVLVSEPQFDSNLRYLQLSDPRAEEMDSTDILFERRFQNVYSPGSIFKPFTAIAGIEEGTLDPNEEKQIEGTQWQPDDSWGGYRVTRVNDSESDIDLETAMKLSDNIYFAQQALDLGEDAMEEWADKFGFGGEFTFDFPLNNSSIANDGIDREILLADTGYGQGEVQISPVHMNALYSIFLNEGSMVQPTLFIDEETDSTLIDIVPVETSDTVLDTLIQVVEDSDGTAYRTEPGHTRSIAGKTGTAELKQEQTVEDGDQIGWYVSFDYEERDLLTTVMVQNVEDKGGSGYVVDLANDFWGSVE
ncbi:penicillin-binding transpeptidase domain-containing protein [Salipaludibacillus daqingensis]|uniref:penicillin-binding transpeptidase domain-containing protein n=1 Tax=Salipaludibacillus daqingensis TaxID=3041001 RepID=UPI002474797F|nr:penicillin-binding transpeptidase domain-containing protein [Salipaludibacillus daqingensis]